MLLPSNYTFDNKIKSLSSRLNLTAKDSNSSRFYINAEIKSENLLLSLSYLLTQIILKLEFLQRGKPAFIEIIEEYNLQHATTLHYENFESLNWISEVGDEVIVPTLIRQYAWKTGYDEEQGKQVIIPEKHRDLILCIRNYQEKYFNDKKLFIKAEDLQLIIDGHGQEKITIEILIQKGIVRHKESGWYSWEDHSEYVRHLSTEIAATLWQQIGGVNADLDDFKRFHKLLRGAGVWPNELINYVPRSSLKRLTTLASDYLGTLKDLQQSPDEFRKLWLNARDQNNHGIEYEIPLVEFDYANPYQFIESIRDIKWQYQNVFGFQEGRNYSLLLLRLIIENDSFDPNPFEEILKILGDLEMPIVIWNLYDQTPSQYPQLIPYFLANTDLTPLAFNLLDKVKISDTLISSAADRDIQYETELEEINILWNEMFEVFFENAETIKFDKEIAVTLARILTDTVRIVFNTNGNTTTNTAAHRSYKKRYDTLLKTVSSRRLLSLHTQGQGIKPRVIFFYLPEISTYISDQILNHQSNRHHFKKLNSGLFDLGIEIVRLTNMRTSEVELTRDLIARLKASSDNLIGALKQSFESFYSIDEVTIKSYDRRSVETKKVSRSADEFGFEIVDWGYLFLHFEKLNYLEDLIKNVADSINFLTSEDIYHEQNQQQVIKIKLFIKSLLLAFLAINDNKGGYEIEMLPVKETLIKLEKLIKENAFKYSKDDIQNSKADVFNDRYNSFGYNLYHQHTADLLYKSIPLFSEQTQEKFTQDYFSDNTDISRLLSAINMIDSKKLQEIISQRISEIDIQDYIQGRFMATDLEYALIEAVNSEQHWSLAEPLIQKLQQHFTAVGKVDINTENFLLEINLLLAFKQKDFAKMTAFEVPKMQFRIHGENTKGERLKKFFTALFKLYNDKEYEFSIGLFKALSSEDPKNIRYAYHTYRAQTLKAIAE